ncbi:hypothetical protein SEUCBS140593_007866 [Sporothrix eucalyptigena]|uniref:Infection structure specific protein n=1 Tax=Sporothrix eucalyptigena TaxID=1812306 RepID=A0ABP0CJM6_9PEZI
MYTKSLLLASLAASAVSAKQLFPGHNAIRRDLQARQTDATNSALPSEEACLTDLASAYASIPTEPPALVSYIETVSVTDPCAFTLPASISSLVESYESELEDWYTSHSAEIASALSECPAYSSYASLSEGTDLLSGTYSDACTTVTYGGSGGGSGTTTTGGSGDTTTAGGKTTTGTATKTTGTGTAAAGGSTTTSTNAGPKETGMVGVAALAMAGVLGVVAAL